MFDDMMAFDYVDLINQLQRPFENISLEFEQTAVAPDTCAVFISETMVVRIGIATGKEHDLLAAEADRPARSRFSSDMVEAMLEDVVDTLVITVEDGPAGSTSEALKLTTCYHATRHLLNQAEASLVHWGQTNTLYVSDEFDIPVGLGYTPQPRRPRRAAAAHTAERPAMGLVAADAGPFGMPNAELANTYDRLEEKMLNVVRTSPPAPEQRDAAPTAETAIDPAREEDRLRRARNRIFAGDLIENGEVDRPAPAQSIGPLQQIAVYLMTITVLLLSFPIGFVMLVYNLVRGEDLNLTARAMALTGVGIGMTSNVEIAQALSFLV